MKKLTLLLLFAMLMAACAQVLGIRPPEKKPFSHHEHTAKAGIGCLKCHAGILQATDTGPAASPDDATTCVSCHTKPHDPRECSGCHGLDYVRDEAQMDLDHLKFSHATHSPRLKDNCAYCHRGVETDSDHVRPTMALCLSCHEHQEDFAAARTCDRCHKDIRAEEVRPASHVAHDGDWLREHGNRAYSARDLCATCHAEKFCAGCHGLTTPALPEKLAFDDTMRAGVHRAGFVSRHSLEARTQPGLCTTCHNTGEFCESCHAEERSRRRVGGEEPAPGRVGRPSRRVERPRACGVGRPVGLRRVPHRRRGELCIGCHRVGAMGGSPHRPGWTSKMRPTIDQPCRSCHEVTP